MIVDREGGSLTMDETFSTLLEHLVMPKPAHIPSDSQEWSDQFWTEVPSGRWGGRLQDLRNPPAP